MAKRIINTKVNNNCSLVILCIFSRERFSSINFMVKRTYIKLQKSLNKIDESSALKNISSTLNKSIPIPPTTTNIINGIMYFFTK